jgi:undecaprenyl-diphosphatase
MQTQGKSPATSPPLTPNSPRNNNALALLTLLTGTIVFVAIAADQLYHGQLFRWNGPIRLFLHEHSTPAGVLFFSALSGLGEFAFLLPFALVVGILLLRRRKIRATLLWATALLGCVVLNESLKRFFQVPRPDRLTFYVFPSHAGYSFPSGHTMGVTITAGTLVLLASHLHLLSPRHVRWAATATILLALLIAFSLMYMGVHTLTDVLAALAVSLAWLGVIRLLIVRFLAPQSPTQK